MKLSLAGLLCLAAVCLFWALPIRLQPLWLLPLPICAAFLPAKLRFACELFLIAMLRAALEDEAFSAAVLADIPGGQLAHVSGRILDQPEATPEALRFQLAVLEWQSLDHLQYDAVPKKLQLSCYNDAPVLQVGDLVQVEVRVRSPRGLANPGLFDYRRWLVSRGFDATGYVRSGSVVGHGQSIDTRLQNFRAQVLTWIQSHEGLKNEGILAALSLGETSGLSDDQWQLFARTGVIHLMVISGLHIGFAAALGYLLFSGPSRLLVLMTKRGMQADYARMGALALAFFYALMAGFSLPTVRASGAALVILAMQWRRSRLSPFAILGLVVCGLLFWQPRIVLQDSFWMSCVAVWVLIMAFAGRAPEPKWRGLIRAQLAMLAGFGGLLLWLGKPLYPIGLISNLFGVPLAASLIVPLLLMSLLLQPVAPALASFLLYMADHACGWLLAGLEFFSALPVAGFVTLHWPAVASWLLIAAGFLAIALPIGKIRWLLACAALPLIAGISNREDYLMQMTVFDVGQGTAVMIEQPGYRLLYDAGPAYISGFNAGTDIIAPYLQSRDLAIDTLIISHDDSDHAGGVEPVLDAIAVGEIYSGGEIARDLGAKACEQGEQWRVGEVFYRFLSPPSAPKPEADNNQSCVLLVIFAQQIVLLAGDIEAAIEKQLLAEYPGLQNIDWLMVPPHGSKTSSIPQFVEQLAPDYAMISAGYGNSYGHPASEVLQRYWASGSTVHNTAVSGLLRYRWQSGSAEVTVIHSRRGLRPWWQTDGAELLCLPDNPCGRRAL